jgi:hypothetical protein
MYQRARWKRFRNWLIAKRPVCQRIVKGERCHAASFLVHHIISPRRRPDLFVDEKNTLCLCEHCHPPDEGTEYWRAGIDYVDEDRYGF